MVGHILLFVASDGFLVVVGEQPRGTVAPTTALAIPSYMLILASVPRLDWRPGCWVHTRKGVCNREDAGDRLLARLFR